MKERIAAFVREKAYKPLTATELMEALKLPASQADQFHTTLGRMEAEGTLVRTRLGRYGAPERMSLAVGRVQGHPKGFAFLTPEVQPELTGGDVFLGPENLAGAMHGDRVVVRLSPGGRPGARLEGEVIRILERAVQRVVGAYEGTRTAGYVTPDDPRLPQDIIIPKGQGSGARAGEKVVCRITRWPEARRPAEGQVIERLGPAGDPGVDILSIVRKHNLPEAFPPKVLQEAEAIPAAIPPEQYHQRVDLRPRLVITIDGEDAKDLDDAVDVEKLPNGRWRLGVHIADVGYYVKEHSALDREAMRRGTSIYLPDRVVPMLPARLSDGVCSLHPGEDKLTVTCDMELDATGRAHNQRLYPTVIRTARRMTYQQVWRILQGDAALQQEYADIVPMLTEMKALMGVLRARRLGRGSLDFDLPEVKLVLNAQGAPVEVRRADRTGAERMIEEFMLAANETVAEHFARAKVPFIYRVHEEPAADRLEALVEFLALFGYHLKAGKKGITAADLQKVTAWAAGRPEESLVNTILLRSLKQARYHYENLGHFGLAAAHYCHFTSPIRRYPDLVVHRIMRELWEHKGNLPGRRKGTLERFTRTAAPLSSERERLAVEAERESYDLKKAQYMHDKVGEVYQGIISGVTAFGLFVQLPNTVEGLVHVSTLTDDYYHFHDRLYALVGERTRRMFRLGDPVAVRLTAVDLAARRLDFMLEPDGMPVVTAPPELLAVPPPPVALATPPKPVAAAVAPAAGPPPALAATPPATPAAAPAPEPAPAAPAPAAAAPAPPAKGKAQRKAEPHRKAEAQAGRARPERRGPTTLDMWGVPIPNGRRRPGGEDEEEAPGTLMYAITPAPDRRREGRKAVAEPPGAPSPATADETGGLPAVPGAPAGDGGAKPRARRRPRRSRVKKSPAAE